MDAHIYEIKVRGSIFGQETFNTFYYGGAAAATALVDLAGGFNDAVLASWGILVSNEWTSLEESVTHVKGGADFADFTVAVRGSVSGECLPPYASYDFTLVRGGVGERNGYKRLAGVAESSQSAGIVAGAAVSNVITLANAMGGTISDGVTDYVPVIRRETIHGVPQLIPVYYTVSNAIYSQIGTQNSRKYGHGR